MFYWGYILLSIKGLQYTSEEIKSNFKNSTQFYESVSFVEIHAL
jgi:hypothetical protein